MIESPPADFWQWVACGIVAVLVFSTHASILAMTKATKAIARVMEQSHAAELIGMKALWQAGLTADETRLVADEIKRRREADETFDEAREPGADWRVDSAVVTNCRFINEPAPPPLGATQAELAAYGAALMEFRSRCGQLGIAPGRPMNDGVPFSG